MSQTSTFQTEQSPGTVGVIDALGMGWRLLMGDFWRLWLVALVPMAIQMGASLIGQCFGAIPFVGPVFSCGIGLLMGLFVQPALAVGLFFAIRRKIDSAEVEVGNVFEGFRQRYWQSVVASLPPFGVGLVIGVAVVVIVAVVVLVGFGLEPNPQDEEVAVAALVGLGLSLPVIIIGILVSILFTFSLLAVWDHPESGWEAVKDSVRLVKSHYLSTLGFAILAVLIMLAAAVAGTIALCVGTLITMPAAAALLHAAVIYLYRSWTGQPLVQPISPVSDGPAGWSPAAPLP